MLSTPRSRPLWFAAVVGLAVCLTSPAARADRVILTDGDELVGSVFGLSPGEIEVETKDGNQTLSVTDYREVAFDGEPAALEEARGQLAAGDPAAAAATLAGVPVEDLADADRRVRDEHAYLTLLAAAEAAAPPQAAAATAALRDFLEQNPRSHHTYAAWEVIGDLLARQGRLDEAATAYRELDRGPPALRVRAAATQGRMLAAAGRPADALRQFEAAAGIAADASDPALILQQREATLGLARCLAEVGKAAQGIATVRGLIEAADPADDDLLASAFAALGACQRAGGQSEDALISFLTVDLVYDGVPAARAEALANLVELWASSNQPERSRAARATLAETYPDSPWTKKLAPPADR
jgi:tetratricopeptide (TPR) repeat protein